MIFECYKCGEKFDDKFYIANNNKEGFRDTLLVHARRHDEDDKINSSFRCTTK